MDPQVPTISPPARLHDQILQQTQSLQARGFLNCRVPHGFSKMSLFKNWFPNDTQRLRTKRYQHAASIWPLVFDIYPVERRSPDEFYRPYTIELLVPKRHLLCEHRPNVRWIHASQLWALRSLFLLPHEKINAKKINNVSPSCAPSISSASTIIRNDEPTSTENDDNDDDISVFDSEDEDDDWVPRWWGSWLKAWGWIRNNIY
jgi:hypothetical protein